MIFEHDASYWSEDAKIEYAVATERRMGQLGVSRKELAGRIGSSPAYITKLLRGDANLTIESMAKVAHALGGRLHIHIAPENSSVRWFEVIDNDRKRENKQALTQAWVDSEKHAEQRHAIAIYA